MAVKLEYKKEVYIYIISCRKVRPPSLSILLQFVYGYCDSWDLSL